MTNFGFVIKNSILTHTFFNSLCGRPHAPDPLPRPHWPDPLPPPCGHHEGMVPKFPE